MTCTLCELPTNGRPITDDGVDGEFCCRGCLEVHRGIVEIGRENSEDEANEAEAFATDVSAAASRTAEGADEPETVETTYLSIDGMHCKTCERYLERTAASLEGVVDARSSYATEVVRVRHDPDAVTADKLADELTRLGYRASLSSGDERRGRTPALERYRAAIGLLVMMPVMAPYLFFIYPTYLGLYPREFLFEPTLRPIVYVPLIVWSTLAVAGLGYPIFRGASVALRVRRPNADVLIALAVIAAYAYSIAAFGLGRRDLYFDVAVMVLVVVTVGTHLESRLKRDALGLRAALTESRVSTTRRRLSDGSTETVSIDECTPGDVVVVRVGERIPIDGTVADGTATVDESLVTGESRPQPKSAGESVLGGTVVTDGALTVDIDDGKSTRDRLVELLWDARSASEDPGRLADRFAERFVPAVITLAVLTAATWLALGSPPGTALLIGVSVLVISCPCSLGIATPLALAAGTSRAANDRIVIANATVLERLVDSAVIVFDKTGTLTTGELTVERTVPADGERAETILARAAAVERRSGHPVAEAIVDAADSISQPPNSTTTMDETDEPGDVRIDEFDRGSRHVAANVDGTRVTVGHPTVFDADWEVPPTVADALETAADRSNGGADASRSVVVGWNGVARGVVDVGDEPREEWGSVLDDLAAAGQRLVVLTGDDEHAAARFADHPAVDDVFAGVRAESKGAIVDRLSKREPTTMIGDGTNDAPALANADLGIAMGSGTELAMDAADVVVTDDDLSSIPAVFEIARETRRRVTQNLAWAIGYNAVAIPLAMLGLINPLIAAVAMTASSLLVVANSARRSVPSRSGGGSSVSDETRPRAGEERSVSSR